MEVLSRERRDGEFRLEVGNVQTICKRTKGKDDNRIEVLYTLDRLHGPELSDEIESCIKEIEDEEWHMEEIPVKVLSCFIGKCMERIPGWGALPDKIEIKTRSRKKETGEGLDICLRLIVTRVTPRRL